MILAFQQDEGASISRDLADGPRRKWAVILANAGETLFRADP
jgi:hypothetical protein